MTDTITDRALRKMAKATAERERWAIVSERERKATAERERKRKRITTKPGRQRERTAPTMKEWEILTAAHQIKQKLQWLADHPRITRRDYERALANGDVAKWHQAKTEAADKEPKLSQG